MVRCPACARPQAARLICECGAPLPVELDYFAALGLARQLILDAELLERLYHDLGRKIHPDRFATAPAALREASLKGTALLTRSYRTLREPVARAKYWLELAGERLAEDNKSVPAELAELVFEVQEQLAELRASNGDHDAARQMAAELKRRRDELKASLHEAHEELEQNFKGWDAASAPRANLVGEMKRILSRIAYLNTLMRDVERGLESLTAS